MAAVSRISSHKALVAKSGVGPTDAELVVDALAGQSWAQEALFTRHGRMVLGLSQRILASRDEAEDLTQDVFVHAFTRLASLQNPQAFAAWLGSMTVRMASKRLRRRRLLVRLGLRRNEPIDPDTVVSVTAPADIASELKVVYGMLERLSVEERIALLLRRVEGLELTEVGERMGLSLATVKRRLSAAEARLERARERM
jgi:RNA polymerase sigma-70 factor (ECF subfamily)